MSESASSDGDAEGGLLITADQPLAAEQGAGATGPGLRKAILRLAPPSVLVQLLSFASSIVLATRLGATTATDAYYLALSVPVVAYAVFLAAIRLGGIPALTTIAREDSEAAFSGASSELISGTLVLATGLTIAITGLMIVVLPLAAGASPVLSALTRQYMVELLPYAVTGALLGALGATLAVRGRFAITALMLAFEPALKSLLLLLFSRQLGAQALIIGNVAGNVLAVFVLWVVVSRSGIRLRPARFWRSPTARSAWKLSLPLVVGQSVLQVNPMIDRVTAASLGSGSVTVFELGVRLFLAPVSLIAATLVAPLAATWSARLATVGWEAVLQSFSRVVGAVVRVAPVLIIVGFFLRHDLVAIVYGSHMYTAASVSKTANVFGMLLLGLVAQTLMVPVSMLFVVQRDTVFPMKIGLANCVLNAVLDVILRGPFGVAGIAFSTALTLSTLCCVYFWQARRRWGVVELRSVRQPVAASAIAGMAAIGCCLVVRTLLGPAASRESEIVAVITIGTSAAFSYGAVLRLTGTRRRHNI